MTTVLIALVTRSSLFPALSLQFTHIFALQLVIQDRKTILFVPKIIFL